MCSRIAICTAILAVVSGVGSAQSIQLLGEYRHTAVNLAVIPDSVRLSNDGASFFVGTTDDNAGGRLFAASKNADGSHRWFAIVDPNVRHDIRIEIGATSNGDLLINTYMEFVPNGSRQRTFCLSKWDGSIVWSLENETTEQPSEIEGNAFGEVFFVRSNRFVKVDAATGAKLYSIKGFAPSQVELTSNGDPVGIFPDSNLGWIEVRDRQNGTLIWRTDRRFSSVLRAADGDFILVDGFTFTRIDEDSGAELWSSLIPLSMSANYLSRHEIVGTSIVAITRSFASSASSFTKINVSTGLISIRPRLAFNDLDNGRIIPVSDNTFGVVAPRIENFFEGATFRLYSLQTLDEIGSVNIPGTDPHHQIKISNKSSSGRIVVSIGSVATSIILGTASLTWSLPVSGNFQISCEPYNIYGFTDGLTVAINAEFDAAALEFSRSIQIRRERSIPDRFAIANVFLNGDLMPRNILGRYNWFQKDAQWENVDWTADRTSIAPNGRIVALRGNVNENIFVIDENSGTILENAVIGGSANQAFRFDANSNLYQLSGTQLRKVSISPLAQTYLVPIPFPQFYAASKLDIDPEGSPVVMADSTIPGFETRVFVRKLSGNAAEAIWTAELSAPVGQRLRSIGVSFDAQGAYYVRTRFISSIPGQSGALLRIDKFDGGTGQLLWSTIIPRPMFNANLLPEVLDESPTKVVTSVSSIFNNVVLTTLIRIDNSTGAIENDYGLPGSYTTTHFAKGENGKFLVASKETDENGLTYVKYWRFTFDSSRPSNGSPSPRASSR